MGACFVPGSRGRNISQVGSRSVRLHLPRGSRIGAGVGVGVGRGRERIEVIFWGYIAGNIAIPGGRPGGQYGYGRWCLALAVVVVIGPARKFAGNRVIVWTGSIRKRGRREFVCICVRVRSCPRARSRSRSRSRSRFQISISIRMGTCSSSSIMSASS
jgi:hypothetical protein